MSYQLQAFIALLAAHWFADFVLQTRWQQTNKSKNNVALFRHVLVYSGVLGITSYFLFAIPSYGLQWLLFVILNGLFHFITDYYTSRWTSRLYAKQNWHDFFIVVGLDQLIHQDTLALTMWALFF